MAKRAYARRRASPYPRVGGGGEVEGDNQDPFKRHLHGQPTARQTGNERQNDTDRDCKAGRPASDDDRSVKLRAVTDRKPDRPDAFPVGHGSVTAQGNRVRPRCSIARRRLSDAPKTGPQCVCARAKGATARREARLHAVELPAALPWRIFGVNASPRHSAQARTPDPQVAHRPMQMRAAFCLRDIEVLPL